MFEAKADLFIQAALYRKRKIVDYFLCFNYPTLYADGTIRRRCLVEGSNFIYHQPIIVILSLVLRVLKSLFFSQNG